MTRNVQEYWREVRAIEAGLPDFVWLSSAGRVTQASRAMAARLIRAGSHKQAAEEEVAAHAAEEEERKRQAKRDAKARLGAAVVVVD